MTDFGRVGHIVSGQDPWRTDCTFMVIAPVEGPRPWDRHVVVLDGRGYIGHRSILPGETGAVDTNNNREIEWFDD